MRALRSRSELDPPRLRRPGVRASSLVVGFALTLWAVASPPTAATGAEGDGAGANAEAPNASLSFAVTGRRAERLDTVPIAPRDGEQTRSVLSLKLPRLQGGERVRFNGEVTITTTCVEPIPRCIGRSYGFDPNLRARIVLAAGAGQVGRAAAEPVSKAVSVTCEQTRPNRNHHCPLTIAGGSFSVGELRDLPCELTRCRLNMTLDASHHDASGEEVVVVGADQTDGSVEGGKARLSAVISRGRVQMDKRTTRLRVNRELPASFEGDKRVVYSQRLDNVEVGDVLLVRSTQRTAVQGLPYFISSQVVLSTRRGAARPSALARRIVSRTGLATETTGFNCTLGSSAFQSPCRSTKAGMAVIESPSRDRQGRPKPLYVNLVSRGFPKLAQARSAFPPAQILDGGSLTVRRLRIER